VVDAAHLSDVFVAADSLCRYEPAAHGFGASTFATTAQ